MTDVVAEILGFTGSLVSSLIWWPQAAMTWRERNDLASLSGISLPTLALQAANALIWFAYAALTGAFWAGVPGFFTLPLVCFTAWLVLRSRKAPKTKPCACGWPDDTLPHDSIVIAPPGYGTIWSPCRGNTTASVPLLATPEDSIVSDGVGS